MRSDPPVFHGNRKSAAPTLTARLFLAGLGLALALIGCLFIWLMGRSFLRAREIRHWPQVQCVILSSELEERHHDPESPTEFRQNVSFGYEWKDVAHTSDRVTLRGSPWSSQRELVEKRVARFQPGSTAECFVDPAHPELAVLLPESLAPGYSIWFPGLFVIGGLGIAIKALLGNRHPSSALAT